MVYIYIYLKMVFIKTYQPFFTEWEFVGSILPNDSEDGGIQGLGLYLVN
jgi:hypothetical protein